MATLNHEDLLETSSLILACDKENKIKGKGNDGQGQQVFDSRLP